MYDLNTPTHQQVEDPRNAVVALELTPEADVWHAMLLAHTFEDSDRHWPLGPIPSHKKDKVAPKKPCLRFIPEHGQEFKIGDGWVVFGGHGTTTGALKKADFDEAYQPIEREDQGEEIPGVPAGTNEGEGGDPEQTL